jgi:hypothetical protein
MATNSERAGRRGSPALLVQVTRKWDAPTLAKFGAGKPVTVRLRSDGVLLDLFPAGQPSPLQ